MISRLRRSGEEYSATLERYTNRLCELDLDREDVPSRSRTTMGQVLFDRRQEEEEVIERAETQLEHLRSLENKNEAMEEESGRRRPLTTSQARATPPHPIQILK